MQILRGIEWLGPRTWDSGPVKTDCFPVTWAADDKIYSAGGDPVSEPDPDGLNFLEIVGTPRDFRARVVNSMPRFVGWGGHGAKPVGLVSVRGDLYLFAHNLGQRRSENAEKNHGYDAQVFRSTDHGLTWEPDIADAETSPMFPGRTFGSPAFINFGKDNADSIDQFVYALSGYGWANGSDLKLGRVPSDSILDASRWEFVAAYSADGVPQWSHEPTEAVPVLTDAGFLGYPSCVYIASIKRFLLTTWSFAVEREDKYSPDDGSILALYESEHPWGPFSEISKVDWESPAVTPYNPQVPLKWFDQEKLEGHLLFSGSWRDGGSSEYYRAQLRPFRLVRAGQAS